MNDPQEFQLEFRETVMRPRTRPRKDLQLIAKTGPTSKRRDRLKTIASRVQSVNTSLHLLGNCGRCGAYGASPRLDAPDESYCLICGGTTYLFTPNPKVRRKA